MRGNRGVRDEEKAGIHKIARSEGANKHRPMQTTIADRCAAADCHQKAANTLG